MSENRGYVYPKTGIGKPTQPRTDQASIALKEPKKSKLFFKDFEFETSCHLKQFQIQTVYEDFPIEELSHYIMEFTFHGVRNGVRVGV
jgi:hypothetical protein